MIQNLGRQIPDDQVYLGEQRLMQEQLKVLTELAPRDLNLLQILQLQLNNAESNFSDLQSIQNLDILTNQLLYCASDLITDLLKAKMNT